MIFVKNYFQMNLLKFELVLNNKKFDYTLCLMYLNQLYFNHR